MGPRTAVAEVDDAAAQQDHEGVEEGEGEGRRAVDGRADGDAAPHQRLHLRHHLHAMEAFGWMEALSSSDRDYRVHVV